MTTYHVEVLDWDGHKHGPSHLEDKLNEYAAQGWEVVSILPTRSGTTAKSFVVSTASGETAELAVVLRRAG